MVHTADAFVVTCIDFRIQKFAKEWLASHVGIGRYDRVAWAGGVKDLPNILKQLEISVRLHKTGTVYLINHEDCGAYGTAGTPEVHRSDLLNARTQILSLFPALAIHCYYLHLDGIFEPIN